MNLRWVIVRAVGCVPVASLRRWLYSLFPHYEIDRSARIGWLVTIDVERLSLGPGSSVGFRSHLSGPMRVELGAEASLGGRNRVECGLWYAEVDAVSKPCARELVLGNKVLITSDHFFDAIGGMYVGEGTCIAGNGSQFWTHGLSVEERSIVIGRNCYIGSAVRFAPGAQVGDGVVVALGSVVASDLSQLHRSLVAGVPARVVREDYRPPGWGASWEDRSE